tara:strand:- start:1226 stop:1483 length:258 start_codon:yes stop_codon:yes gene_type:complete
MKAEEIALRKEAEMVNLSLLFFEEKITDLITQLEAIDQLETPEGFYMEELKLEKELKYLLMRSDYEKKEMEKVEAKIQKYIDENS